MTERTCNCCRDIFDQHGHKSERASRWQLLLGFCAAAVFLLCAGCGSEQQAPGKSAWGSGQTGVSAQVRSEAREIFTGRCASCHGETGRGDGPGSVALDPKPVDFSDPAWQQSVSDDDIKRIIVGGHVIGKSMAMPGNPDLKAKPEVVVALCEYIRQVGQR